MAAETIFWTSLIPGAVLIVLRLLVSVAEREARNAPARRTATYPKVLKALVVLAWIVVSAIPFLLRRFEIARGWQSAVNAGLLSLAVMLVVHLEVFRTKISWDGYWMYTRSPWRRDRRIPIGTVSACLSWPVLSLYILRTQKGLVILPAFTVGAKNLLAALPADCFRNRDRVIAPP